MFKAGCSTPFVWARASIPRHAFTTWVFVQHRLPTKMRLHKYTPQPNLRCFLCNSADEDDVHQFTAYPYAMEVWTSLQLWWPLPNAVSPTSLSTLKAPRTHKQITYAIYAATIYVIWYARNQLLFKNRCVAAQHIARMIKDQIRH